MMVSMRMIVKTDRASSTGRVATSTRAIIVDDESDGYGEMFWTDGSIY